MDSIYCCTVCEYSQLPDCTCKAMNGKEKKDPSSIPENIQKNVISICLYPPLCFGENHIQMICQHISDATNGGMLPFLVEFLLQGFDANNSILDTLSHGDSNTTVSSFLSWESMWRH